MAGVVYWQRFDPARFEYEFDEDELARHGVTTDEVVEVIWNGFVVRRNKGRARGYQLVGLTDAGRMLKLIVYGNARASYGSLPDGMYEFAEESV